MLPTWERELKRKTENRGRITGTQLFPTWERELKLEVRIFRMFCEKSLPPWERELKHNSFRICDKSIVLLPTWERELKPFWLTYFMVALIIAPYVGA